MPAYAYRCDDLHETLWIGRFEKRPATTDCTYPECSQTAAYTLARPPSREKLVELQAAKRAARLREPISMALHEFHCDACGELFDEIVDFSMGEQTDAGKPCPDDDCDGHGRWRPSARIDRNSERYPRFDRGLGLWLKSEAHRREVCKKLGLTPVEGDFDIEKTWSTEDRTVDDERAVLDDYHDRLEHHPAFRTYREALDRGEFDDDLAVPEEEKNLTLTL